MPQFPEPVEPARRRSGWIVLAIVAVVLAGSAIAVWQARTPIGGSSVAAVTDADARAPEGVRIRVRVANATGTAGLARRATLLLRDYGYDVVEFDTDPRQRSATAIVVHTGHDEWGERLRRTLGVGVIERRPDSLRYLDLTVLIGNDWKPPTEPLRP